MRAVFIIMMLIITSLFTSGQDSVHFNRNIFSLPVRLLGIASKKSDRVQERLEYYTEKYLRKIHKQKLHFKKQLIKKDGTAAAQQIFGNINKEYDSRIDSLKTALQFLEKTNIIKQSAV